MTLRYIGAKEVLAWPSLRLVDGQPTGDNDPALTSDGYSVRYADGYTSWSPKDVFEAAYRVAEGDEQRLNFGDALHYLKLGRKVARAGWNGKGMWLALTGGVHARRVPYQAFWSPHNANHALEQGGYATVLPSITMRTADGSILMGWLASQTDMLAEDWMVLP